jgi:hypothetical protein
MKKYKGTLESKVYWIIPFIIAINKNIINNKIKTFSLQLTPFVEINLFWFDIKYGFDEI